MPWNKDGSRKSSAFYKMKGNPMQRNFGIPSPVKHSGADYKAEVKANYGIDVSSSDVKGHDKGHETKWNTDHSDKQKKEKEEVVKKTIEETKPTSKKKPFEDIKPNVKRDIVPKKNI